MVDFPVEVDETDLSCFFSRLIFVLLQTCVLIVGSFVPI